MANVNISYNNLVSMANLLPEIFTYNEIIIYGTGETGNNIGLIITSYIKSKNVDYEKVRRIKYYDMAAKEGQYLCDIPVLKPDFNKCHTNSVLIIALDSGDIDKQVIRISSLGFDKIIDGYKMSKCFYNPLLFKIKNSEFESIETFKEICIRSDIAATQDTTLDCIQDKLIENPNDFDLLIELGNEYENCNDILSANDAYRRALKNVKDEFQIRLVNRKIDRLAGIIKQTEFSDWDYAKSLNKIIVVNYVGRSGSLFFSSLLDNHPQMIVMPFGKIYDPDPDMAALFYSNPEGVLVDELVEAFNVKEGIWYNKEAVVFSIGDDNKAYPSDYNSKYLTTLKGLILAESLKNKGVVTEKFLFKARYFSHMKALNNNIDFSEGIPYIVYQIHSIDSNLLKKFIFMFPHTIQLATLRNPLIAFGSLIALAQRTNILGTATIINALRYSFQNPILIEDDYAKRTILVRIEDLNRFTRETMEAVIRYLNIDWNDCLLESTVNGKILYDNYDSENKNLRVTGPRTTGISKTYGKYFNSFDLFRLEALFVNLLKAWQYESHNYLEFDTLKELSKYPFKFENEMNFEDESKRSKFRKMISDTYIELLEKSRDLKYLNKLRLVKPDAIN